MGACAGKTAERMPTPVDGLYPSGGLRGYGRLLYRPCATIMEKLDGIVIYSVSTWAALPQVDTYQVARQ